MQRLHRRYAWCTFLMMRILVIKRFTNDELSIFLYRPRAIPSFFVTPFLHILQSDLLLKFTNLCSILTFCSLDSMVGTATCYGLESSGLEPRWARIFSYPSRPAPRTTKPPVQWVPGLLAGGESCRSVGLTSHAEVKERVQLHFYSPSGLSWPLRSGIYLYFDLQLHTSGLLTNNLII